jgi:hypothetical protein
VRGLIHGVFAGVAKLLRLGTPRFGVSVGSDGMFRDHSFQVWGEQDGPVERTFRERLAKEFLWSPAVLRAYLVRASSALEPVPRPMVLIRSHEPHALDVVDRVHSVFRELFAADQFIDIAFLRSDAAEAQVARTAAPFFERPG